MGCAFPAEQAITDSQNTLPHADLVICHMYKRQRSMLAIKERYGMIIERRTYKDTYCSTKSLSPP